MSEEIADTNGLLDEIARLRADLATVRANLDQMQASRDAERAARRAVEADNAKLLMTIDASLKSYCGRCGSCHRCIRELPILNAPHPGAALLAELDAARAVGAYLNDRTHWTADICPTCGFGRRLDGSEYHGSGCVLATYNAVAQARHE